MRSCRPTGLASAQAWRDRRLMALAAHKRRRPRNRELTQHSARKDKHGANKVIITCAVTGAIHTPSMSPYLPVTRRRSPTRRSARRRRARRSCICTPAIRTTAGPTRARRRSRRSSR